MAVDTDRLYLNEAERDNLDIYDDFKLKNTLWFPRFLQTTMVYVVDGGPTINRQWVNDSRLLDCVFSPLFCPIWIDRGIEVADFIPIRLKQRGLRFFDAKKYE